MDWFEGPLHRAAQILSRMLDPWIAALERVGVLVRQQMDAIGIPYDWQSPIITATWVIELALVLRFFSGWWRLLVIVVAALTLAKAYGMLPGG